MAAGTAHPYVSLKEGDVDQVEPIKARSMLDAAAAATADRPQVERRRRLTPAALAVTNQKVCGAYSPIVIAGAVRLADFILLSLIGIALYFGYVSRLAGFHWGYVAALFVLAPTEVICLPA